jgi:hypothetical protein
MRNYSSLALMIGLIMGFVPTVWAKTGLLVLAHGVASHGDPHHGGSDRGGHDHLHWQDLDLGNTDAQSNTIRALSSKDVWEQEIHQVADHVRRRTQLPVEVAFGMWNRANFQSGVNRLAAQGVTDLRVIPLFISSHSDVIRAQKYQFGFSNRNPLGFDPGRIRIPTTIKKVKMSKPLDRAPELSAILQSRVNQMKRNENHEELILVAHGPVADTDDQLWLADLSWHAHEISFGSTKHVITVRDDADPSVRDKFSLRLRALVQGVHQRGRVPLVVPVLMSQGGIEQGIIERLKGLQYVYSGQTLLPDHRIADWVVRMAQMPN